MRRLCSAERHPGFSRHFLVSRASPWRAPATADFRRPYILDGRKQIATGCSPEEADKAERALSKYITGKYRPERQARDIDVIPIADVLSIYVDDKGITGKKTVKRIVRLNAFFGAKVLGEMNRELCREYVRGNKGRARRDLEDLRAAINHHGREGLHHAVIGVVLPEAGLPRERWLS